MRNPFKRKPKPTNAYVESRGYPMWSGLLGWACKEPTVESLKAELDAVKSRLRISEGERFYLWENKGYQGHWNFNEHLFKGPTFVETLGSCPKAESLARRLNKVTGEIGLYDYLNPGDAEDE